MTFLYVNEAVIILATSIYATLIITKIFIHILPHWELQKLCNLITIQSFYQQICYSNFVCVCVCERWSRRRRKMAVSTTKLSTCRHIWQPKSSLLSSLLTRLNHIHSHRLSQQGSTSRIRPQISQIFYRPLNCKTPRQCFLKVGFIWKTASSKMGFALRKPQVIRFLSLLLLIISS